MTNPVFQTEAEFPEKKNDLLLFWEGHKKLFQPRELLYYKYKVREFQKNSKLNSFL